MGVRVDATISVGNIVQIAGLAAAAVAAFYIWVADVRVNTNSIQANQKTMSAAQDSIKELTDEVKDQGREQTKALKEMAGEIRGLREDMIRMQERESLRDRYGESSGGPLNR